MKECCFGASHNPKILDTRLVHYQAQGKSRFDGGVNHGSGLLIQEYVRYTVADIRGLMKARIRRHGIQFVITRLKVPTAQSPAGGWTMSYSDTSIRANDAYEASRIQRYALEHQGWTVVSGFGVRNFKFGLGEKDEIFGWRWLRWIRRTIEPVSWAQARHPVNEWGRIGR
jgi:hypothetical protein